MKVVHLTTVDLSLRYLIFPQLIAAKTLGESYGISAPGPYVADLEQAGIHHIPLTGSTRGMHPLADLRAMRGFWNAIKELKPDIVHTHNPKPGVYGRILARLSGVPIVVNTVHGLYATSDSPLIRRAAVYALETIASRFSDAELVQNVEDLEFMRRRRMAPPGRLRLLGNGVDLDRFNPEARATNRDAERRRLGLTPGEVAVGMVGRLVAEKGIPELIEAARGLGPTVRVFVAGPSDPEKGDSLGTRLIREGEAAGVAFVGMRSNIEVFFSAMDIFVLPSHREGFPRAAMEAAATGLPLIVTDIRGCRQVVDDSENGFIVPVGDPVRLTQAITQLVSNEDMRARMGSASAEKALRHFDERTVVDIVMETYVSLAETKGLAWKFPIDGAAVSLRRAEPGDENAIARLHCEMIGTGFLSSLGVGFLSLLYGSLINDPDGKVHVAEIDGNVVAFIAGTTDTSAFYRRFVSSKLMLAVVKLLPALVRPATWRRIWETWRYGTGRGAKAHAELLSMAVAANARRRGLGRRLVEKLLRDAEVAGVTAMKVVVGVDNNAAIRLYSSAGFTEPEPFEVHRGEASWEMVWQSRD